MKLKAYTEIIETLLAAPKDFKIEGHFGSGPVARPMFKEEEGEELSKIILPGDKRLLVVFNIYTLLYDLSIDLGMDPDVRERLFKEISAHNVPRLVAQLMRTEEVV